MNRAEVTVDATLITNFANGAIAVVLPEGEALPPGIPPFPLEMVAPPFIPQEMLVRGWGELHRKMKHVETFEMTMSSGQRAAWALRDGRWRREGNDESADVFEGTHHRHGLVARLARIGRRG